MISHSVMVEDFLFTSRSATSGFNSPYWEVSEKETFSWPHLKLYNHLQTFLWTSTSNTSVKVIPIWRGNRVGLAIAAMQSVAAFYSFYNRDTT